MSENSQPRSARPGLREFRKYVRPYIWHLIAATTAMVLNAAIQLSLPFLTGKVIDSTLLPGGMEHLRQIVLQFVGLCLVLGVFSFTASYLINSASTRLLCDLRSRLFNHIILMAPDFFDVRRTGELLSRIGSDLAVVQGFFTGTIPGGIQSMLSFTGTVAILFVIHVRLALVALLVIPPVTVLSKYVGDWMRKLSTKQQDALAESTAFAEEMINGIRTVQMAGRETLEGRRYWEKLGILCGLQMENVRRGSSYGAMLAVINMSSNLFVLWYGGELILSKQLSPGALVAFMLYAGAMQGLVRGFSNMYTGYQVVVGASIRIFEILNTRSSVPDPVGVPLLPITKGSLSFQNVSFHYGAARDRLAVKNIDLEIQAGEMVGLVGPSGAGKTTLFSLLLRFYDPIEGSIRIDGRDLKSIRLEDLRRAISIVPQDIFLFTGTIADNIRYFKPDATMDEVRASAISAGAHEFIEQLPKGYDELVGQRGLNLSGGQRQRIAIARAFIANPAILLLDEATSALDPDSEEKVRQALTKLLRGRTTLVIAHRLSTARQANRILVLEHGRIIGSESHDALYNSNELYRRYWNLQSVNGKNSTSAENSPLIDVSLATADREPAPV